MRADISAEDHDIIHVEASKRKPVEFNPVGNEAEGFDPGLFLLETNLNQFQFIDRNGYYDTVEIYDHNHIYKNDFAWAYQADLSYLEGSATYTKVLSAAVEHMLFGHHTHTEFDFAV
ncbi:MAG: hypothetical protein JSS50_03425 [Proteobacteria bacterium]|nr:hypothetical protein [Pseudomonadota bacterium]